MNDIFSILHADNARLVDYTLDVHLKCTLERNIIRLECTTKLDNWQLTLVRSTSGVRFEGLLVSLSAA